MEPDYGYYYTEFSSLMAWILVIPGFLNVNVLKNTITKDTITMIFPFIEASLDFVFLLFQLFPLHTGFNISFSRSSVLYTLDSVTCMQWTTGLYYRGCHDKKEYINPFLATVAMSQGDRESQRSAKITSAGRSVYIDTILMIWLFDVSLLCAVVLLRQRYMSVTKPADFKVTIHRPYRYIIETYWQVRKLPRL